MTYDAQGRRLTKTDFNGSTIHYAYDLASRLISTSYPDGSSVAYTYTATGAPATVIDSRGTTRYSYDAADRLTELTAPNGQQLRYSYDAQGNRTALTAQIGGAVLTTGYTYDALILL